MKPYDFKSLESGWLSRVLTDYGVLRNFHKQVPHDEAVRLRKPFIYAGFRGFESVKKGILPTIYPRNQELS